MGNKRPPQIKEHIVYDVAKSKDVRNWEFIAKIFENLNF